MPDRGLTRRVLLAGAGGLLLAGCARPPITLVTPTASPTGTVRAQLEDSLEIFGRNTELLGIAVRDLRTGVDFDHRGDYSSQSASMAKVMIVAMALRKARADGGELSFENYGRATRAITVSDNDAADALWEYAGGPDAYQALATDLGLPDTRRDPVSTFWSWTWTTPSDQRLLLDLLLHGTPALHVDDRLYLLELMGKTTADHTWGVGNPRSSEVDVWMKNGWVQFESTDGLWAVNSMGHVRGDGRDYLAALMCRVDSFEEGRRLLDAIGASLFAIMGSGTLR